MTHSNPHTKVMNHRLVLYALRKISPFLQTIPPIGVNPPATNWVPLISHGSHHGSPKFQSFCGFSCLYRRACSVRDPPRAPRRVRRSVVEARGALLEYLHCTRGLEFVDAEHMSNCSPVFLSKLLAKVESKREVGRSIIRFLRYHPIDEFELFLESLGLEPNEIGPLIPRDMIFLSESKLLLENYQVLRNYGFAHGTIGKFYKELNDIFGNEPRVLDLKLRAFEDFGLNKGDVIDVLCSNAYLLVGDNAGEFIALLRKLSEFGIDHEWLCCKLHKKVRYRWSCMMGVLRFLSELGFDAKEIGSVIRRRSDFLLDNSGRPIFMIAALFLKCGGTKDDFLGLLREFPHVQVGSFATNLLRGLVFLVGIGMEPQDTRNILIRHTRVLGCYSLKSHNTAIAEVNGGRKWLREFVKEDPCRLVNWAMRIRSRQSQKQRRKFLLRLGFAENSEELETAIRCFRGKGDELQERHDFLVRRGLKPNDVLSLIKMAPNILNHKIDSLSSKVDYLVDVLGYPLETLVVFPYFLQYTLDRVKHRFSVYNWLKDEGKVNPTLKLSTIVALPDKQFIKHYVSRHPNGLEVWEKLKKEIYAI